LNREFFVKSFLTGLIYCQCKLPHGSLLKSIQVFKYKPHISLLKRNFAPFRNAEKYKKNMIFGRTLRISCYRFSADDALFYLITGHGKTAASASIPSKYQTIVSDNSERKGFLSRSKRFEGMNVVCTVE